MFFFIVIILSVSLYLHSIDIDIKRYPQIDEVGDLLSCDGCEDFALYDEHDGHHDDKNKEQVPPCQVVDTVPVRDIPTHNVDDDDEAEEEASWSSADDECIEVAPGIFKLLRGTDETAAALEQGACIETMCYVCDIRLACLEDVECVVCPQCISCSPVEGFVATSDDPNETGWAGMGIHIE